MPARHGAAAHGGLHRRAPHAAFRERPDGHGPDDGGAGLREVVRRGRRAGELDAVAVDPTADDERRVVITDDFGQRIQMSLAQLAVIVDDARRGVLDDLLAARR